jgi:predicted Zn-dependent protease
MSRYGTMSDVWPYAAAVACVFAVVLILVYKFGSGGSRRGAAWRYTAELDQIQKLMDEKRYDEAAALLPPLLRKSDIPGVFFDLAAAIASKRGRPAEAEKYWLALRRYYPEIAWSHMRVARFLLQKGKTKQAHKVLDRARKIVVDPGNLNAVLAETAQASQRWDEAIRLWAELRVSAPGEVNGYLQARVCLLAVGRVEEADALIADVAARFPNHPHVKAVLAAAAKQAAPTPATPPPEAGA